MADLCTGKRTPTRERLASLLEEIATGEASTDEELAGARLLVERNGSERQRGLMLAEGAEAVARDLADSFLAERA